MLLFLSPMNSRAECCNLLPVYRTIQMKAKCSITAEQHRVLLTYMDALTVTILSQSSLVTGVFPPFFIKSLVSNHLSEGTIFIILGGIRKSDLHFHTPDIFPYSLLSCITRRRTESRNLTPGLSEWKYKVFANMKEKIRNHEMK